MPHRFKKDCLGILSLHWNYEKVYWFFFLLPQKQVILTNFHIWFEKQKPSVLWFPLCLDSALYCVFLPRSTAWVKKKKKPTVGTLIFQPFCIFVAVRLVILLEFIIFAFGLITPKEIPWKTYSLSPHSFHLQMKGKCRLKKNK